MIACPVPTWQPLSVLRAGPRRGGALGQMWLSSSRPGSAVHQVFNNEDLPSTSGKQARAIKQPVLLRESLGCPSKTTEKQKKRFFSRLELRSGWWWGMIGNPSRTTLFKYVCICICIRINKGKCYISFICTS